MEEYLNIALQNGQKYCKPEHTILDNLSLIRAIIDLFKLRELDVGLFLIRKKPLIGLITVFLFKALEGFGVGRTCISWVKLMYSGSSVLLKLGGVIS